MLDDIEGADQIEAAGGKRQRQDAADLRLPPALVQGGDGGFAQIDEIGTDDRRAGSQCRARVRGDESRLLASSEISGQVLKRSGGCRRESRQRFS
jgi:hypothetical protein